MIILRPCCTAPCCGLEVADGYLLPMIVWYIILLSYRTYAHSYCCGRGRKKSRKKSRIHGVERGDASGPTSLLHRYSPPPLPYSPDPRSPDHHRISHVHHLPRVAVVKQRQAHHFRHGFQRPRLTLVLRRPEEAGCRRRRIPILLLLLWRQAAHRRGMEGTRQPDIGYYCFCLHIFFLTSCAARGGDIHLQGI